MSEKDNEKRLAELEKQVKDLKEKLDQKEKDEYIKEWYEKQKGSGYPPLPHF